MHIARTSNYTLIGREYRPLKWFARSTVAVHLTDVEDDYLHLWLALNAHFMAIPVNYSHNPGIV